MRLESNSSRQPRPQLWPAHLQRSSLIPFLIACLEAQLLVEQAEVRDVLVAGAQQLVRRVLLLPPAARHRQQQRHKVSCLALCYRTHHHHHHQKTNSLSPVNRTHVGTMHAHRHGSQLGRWSSKHRSNHSQLASSPHTPPAAPSHHTGRLSTHPALTAGPHLWKRSTKDCVRCSPARSVPLVSSASGAWRCAASRFSAKFSNLQRAGLGEEVATSIRTARHCPSSGSMLKLE
jgi:hypothetical protein